MTIDGHNRHMWGGKGDMPKPTRYGFLEDVQQQAGKIGIAP
jgi:hypothetical protein